MGVIIDDVSGSVLAAILLLPVTQRLVTFIPQLSLFLPGLLD